MRATNTTTRTKNTTVSTTTKTGTQDSTHNPLNLLPEAALGETIQQLSIAQSTFCMYIDKQPRDTVIGIYNNTYEIIKSPHAITFAPGCSKGSYMVSSTRNREQPRCIIRGRVVGEYKCE